MMFLLDQVFTKEKMYRNVLGKKNNSANGSRIELSSCEKNDVPECN